MALLRNRKGIFHESGDIYWNASYFAIKVQNALTEVSCKTSFNIVLYSTLFLPPKCMAESFTSTSCIIFSGLQLASVRAKDLYNLMNFCIHMMLLLWNPFCFISKVGSGTCNFLPTKVTFSQLIMHKPVCILFSYH